MTSQIHPKLPPIQFIFSSLPARLGRSCCCVWRVGVPVALIVVVTSHSFQLAFVPAAAEAPQYLRKEQADQDQDDGDGAGRAHEVGHEALLVHLQREGPGRVTRTTI